MLHKDKTSEAFEEIHQVIIYGISDNMAPLVQPGKYVAINTTDKKTMGYYEIKFFLEAYTLQEDTTCDGKISTSGEMVLKVHYLIYMQETTNCYREKNSSNKL